jgi:hypothetical protein
VNAEDLRLTDALLVRLGKGKHGESNPNWTGDDASYQARHKRLHAIRGRADHCIHRASGHCNSQKFEWAQIHGTSGLSVYDYVQMCKSCHWWYDYKGGNARPRPGAKGSKNGRAKMNEDIVAEIRSRPVVKGSIMAWSREFNVHHKTIKQVIDGETYKHVLAADPRSAEFRVGRG